MPRPLPKTKPERLPQPVIDSLKHRQGFHVSEENPISQNIVKKLATAMKKHKICPVSRIQLELHLKELNEWLELEPGDPDNPIERELENDYQERRDALAKFLKENK